MTRPVHNSQMLPTLVRCTASMALALKRNEPFFTNPKPIPTATTKLANALSLRIFPLSWITQWKRTTIQHQTRRGSVVWVCDIVIGERRCCCCGTDILQVLLTFSGVLCVRWLGERSWRQTDSCPRTDRTEHFVPRNQKNNL